MNSEHQEVLAIGLSGGHATLVDAEDYEHLFRTYPHSGGRSKV